MSGQKVDLTALAPRDDRFATQGENAGDGVTARAETDRRLGIPTESVVICARMCAEHQFAARLVVR
jgi:hypothetical protein